MLNRMKKTLQHCYHYILVAVFLYSIFFPFAAQAQVQSNPKTANMFLHWTLKKDDAQTFAKWDVLILDMETQYTSRDVLQAIKTHNPHIKIFAYITPQEITTAPNSTIGAMRKKLRTHIADSWYLQNANGNRLSWWPNTHLLNMSDKGPKINGKTIQDVFAYFVRDEILATGLWDGIFYDNAWDNISYFAGNTIDIDANGTNDPIVIVDAAWKNGMKKLYTKTKDVTGGKYPIIGNGFTSAYSNELDGLLVENFASWDWETAMTIHKSYTPANPRAENISIIHNTAFNSHFGRYNFKNMRFGLTSALLYDAYYAYDFGDTDHGQLWWYDEYARDLGVPQNSANQIDSTLWQRFFSKGVSLVNTGDVAKEVQLNGEYEKIHGTQDTEVNNGAIISEVTLSGKDGVLLLKTNYLISDVVFTNGDFVRFLRPDKTRVRNGFFLFDDAFRGGDTVLRTDINNDTKEDVVRIKRNAITATRHDNQRLFNIYPYTANFSGTMHMAYGDITGNGKQEIIVAPAKGYALPIKIYDAYGKQLFHDWYPFGVDYTGGITIDTGVFGRGHTASIVLGGIKNNRPVVARYGGSLGLQTEFFITHPIFAAGVTVAAGDVDGNGIDEIVIGTTPGHKPYVQVLRASGIPYNTPFVAYTSFDAPGARIQLKDMDFDGKDDIIVMGN